MFDEYHATMARSLSDPEGFWAEAAEKIDWIRRWERVFDPEAGIYGRWFVGGALNACYNALDRHVEGGRADQLALIYDSPITGSQRSFTFSDLQSEVVALASVLRKQGVGKGDRVIIYMPMVPEAVFAMLACARLGVIHSVVFGGFAAHELATRIDDSQPKLVVSASCGLEPGRTVSYKPLLDEALATASHTVERCLIVQRDHLRCELVEGRDLDYSAEVSREKAAGAEVECVAVEATDPLYILYTSGTTGRPKGVVRDTGGHMVALAWSMESEYGVKPGEVFWAASDVGWVVGHSYITYGPLISGCTTVLFEGKPVGTPDAGTFWRVIADHGVATLFTAPSALRAIRGADPRGNLIAEHDVSSLRTLFLAGERADPPTLEWAENKLGVPTIDHWWQTETGSPVTQSSVGSGMLPVKHGSSGVPMPGYDVRVLDDTGHEVPPGDLGNVVIKLPLPPGCLPTLWKADQRFREVYLDEFPGYYKTADAGFVDQDGYLFIMARTDDVINVAGHRLSTGGMEEVVAAHPDVAECAVVGISDSMKGQVPCGFVVLNARTSRDPADVEQEVVALVRDRIGAVAALKTVITVKRLPKTRSGKTLRGTIQKIADQMDWTVPPTIDDPVILTEIGEALEARGMVEHAKEPYPT